MHAPSALRDVREPLLQRGGTNFALVLWLFQSDMAMQRAEASTPPQHHRRALMGTVPPLLPGVPVTVVMSHAVVLTLCIRKPLF